MLDRGLFEAASYSVVRTSLSNFNKSDDIRTSDLDDIRKFLEEKTLVFPQEFV